LFTFLNDIFRNEENDTIVWKWMSSSEYFATSAYEIQFLGASTTFKASAVWKANTETKCFFFAWLALLRNIPTVDNLMRKSWPCDPNCSLCYCILETGDHLLTECNFFEAVWDRITQYLILHPTLIPFQKGSISNWITTLSWAGSKE
jgi:hypothetical protein